MNKKIILQALTFYRNHLSSLRTRDFELEIRVDTLIEEYSKQTEEVKQEEYCNENMLTKTELINEIVKMKEEAKSILGRLHSSSRETLIGIYHALKEREDSASKSN